MSPDTRSRVLSALRAAPGPISGEDIAEALGVSRVAVSKHVAALREAGYGIESHFGTGYAFISAVDAPIPAEVDYAVRELTGSPWTWGLLRGGMATESTNDDAKALARTGAPEGTVVLAGRQTAGRGRLGRVWDSAEGGVYSSVVLRPDVVPAAVAPLSLVIAVGVARGLLTMGVEPRLKWPNDVELASGKVAGILLEMSAESDRVDWVVAGVGLNVRPGVERREGAGYIMDEVPDVRRAAAAAAVLEGIRLAYTDYLALGFAGLRAEFGSRHRLDGEHVVVRERDGSVRAAGRVETVDDDGRLVLATDAGEVRIASGDVTLRNPAA